MQGQYNPQSRSSLPRPIIAIFPKLVGEEVFGANCLLGRGGWTGIFMGLDWVLVWHLAFVLQKTLV